MKTLGFCQPKDLGIQSTPCPIRLASDDLGSAPCFDNDIEPNNLAQENEIGESDHAKNFECSTSKNGLTNIEYLNGLLNGSLIPAVSLVANPPDTSSVSNSDEGSIKLLLSKNICVPKCSLTMSKLSVNSLSKPNCINKISPLLSSGSDHLNNEKSRKRPSLECLVAKLHNLVDDFDKPTLSCEGSSLYTDSNYLPINSYKVPLEAHEHNTATLNDEVKGSLDSLGSQRENVSCNSYRLNDSEPCNSQVNNEMKQVILNQVGVSNLSHMLAIESSKVTTEFINSKEIKNYNCTVPKIICDDHLLNDDYKIKYCKVDDCSKFVNRDIYSKQNIVEKHDNEFPTDIEPCKSNLLTDRLVENNHGPIQWLNLKEDSTVDTHSTCSNEIKNVEVKEQLNKLEANTGIPSKEIANFGCFLQCKTIENSMPNTSLIPCDILENPSQSIAGDLKKCASSLVLEKQSFVNNPKCVPTEKNMDSPASLSKSSSNTPMFSETPSDASQSEMMVKISDAVAALFSSTSEEKLSEYVNQQPYNKLTEETNSEAIICNATEIGVEGISSDTPNVTESGIKDMSKISDKVNFATALYETNIQQSEDPVVLKCCIPVNQMDISKSGLPMEDNLLYTDAEVEKSTYKKEIMPPTLKKSFEKEDLQELKSYNEKDILESSSTLQISSKKSRLSPIKDFSQVKNSASEGIFKLEKFEQEFSAMKDSSLSNSLYLAINSNSKKAKNCEDSFTLKGEFEPVSSLDVSSITSKLPQIHMDLKKKRQNNKNEKVVTEQFELINNCKSHKKNLSLSDCIHPPTKFDNFRFINKEFGDDSLTSGNCMQVTNTSTFKSEMSNSFFENTVNDLPSSSANVNKENAKCQFIENEVAQEFFVDEIDLGSNISLEKCEKVTNLNITSDYTSFNKEKRERTLSRENQCLLNRNKTSDENVKNIEDSIVKNSVQCSNVNTISADIENIGLIPSKESDIFTKQVILETENILNIKDEFKKFPIILNADIDQLSLIDFLHKNIEMESGECFICKIYFEDDLKLHAAQVHSCITYIPVYLSKTFQHYMQERVGISSLPYSDELYGSPTYVCKSCGFILKSIESVRLHINTHENIYMVVASNCSCNCDKIPYSYPQQRLRKLLLSSKYICSFCHYYFACEHSLINHLKITHFRMSSCLLCNIGVPLENTIKILAHNESHTCDSEQVLSSFIIKDFIEPLRDQTHFSWNALNNHLNYLDGKIFRIRTPKNIKEQNLYYNQLDLTLPVKVDPEYAVTPECYSLSPALEINKYLKGKLASRLTGTDIDEYASIGFDMPVQILFKKKFSSKRGRKPSTSFCKDNAAKVNRRFSVSSVLNLHKLPNTAQHDHDQSSSSISLRRSSRHSKVKLVKEEIAIEIKEDSDESSQLLSRTRSGMHPKEILDGNMNKAIDPDHDIEPHPMTEISGEWANYHTFVCCSCGAVLFDLAAIMDHKWDAHPGVWCAHTMIRGQGAVPEMFCRQYLPAIIEQSDMKIKRRGVRNDEPKSFLCTQCNSSFSKLDRFHAHLIECGGLLHLFSSKKKTKNKKNFRFRRRKGQGIPSQRYANNSSAPTPNKAFNSGTSTPSKDLPYQLQQLGSKSAVKRRLENAIDSIENNKLKSKLQAILLQSNNQNGELVGQSKRNSKMKLRKKIMQRKTRLTRQSETSLKRSARTLKSTINSNLKFTKITRTRQRVMRDTKLSDEKVSGMVKIVLENMNDMEELSKSTGNLATLPLKAKKNKKNENGLSSTPVASTELVTLITDSSLNENENKSRTRNIKSCFGNKLRPLKMEKPKVLSENTELDETNKISENLSSENSYMTPTAETNYKNTNSKISLVEVSNTVVSASSITPPLNNLNEHHKVTKRRAKNLSKNRLLSNKIDITSVLPQNLPVLFSQESTNNKSKKCITTYDIHKSSSLPLRPNYENDLSDISASLSNAKTTKNNADGFRKRTKAKVKKIFKNKRNCCKTSSTSLLTQSIRVPIDKEAQPIGNLTVVGVHEDTSANHEDNFLTKPHCDTNEENPVCVNESSFPVNHGCSLDSRLNAIESLNTNEIKAKELSKNNFDYYNNIDNSASIPSIFNAGDKSCKEHLNRHNLLQPDNKCSEKNVASSIYLPISLKSKTSENKLSVIDKSSITDLSSLCITTFDCSEEKLDRVKEVAQNHCGDHHILDTSIHASHFNEPISKLFKEDLNVDASKMEENMTDHAENQFYIKSNKSKNIFEKLKDIPSLIRKVDIKNLHKLEKKDMTFSSLQAPPPVHIKRKKRINVSTSLENNENKEDSDGTSEPEVISNFRRERVVGRIGLRQRHFHIPRYSLRPPTVAAEKSFLTEENMHDKSVNNLDTLASGEDVSFHVGSNNKESDDEIIVSPKKFRRCNIEDDDENIIDEKKIFSSGFYKEEITSNNPVVDHLEEDIEIYQKDFEKSIITKTKSTPNKRGAVHNICDVAKKKLKRFKLGCQNDNGTSSFEEIFLPRSKFNSLKGPFCNKGQKKRHSKNVEKQQTLNLNAMEGCKLSEEDEGRKCIENFSNEPTSKRGGNRRTSFNHKRKLPITPEIVPPSDSDVDEGRKCIENFSNESTSKRGGNRRSSFNRKRKLPITPKIVPSDSESSSDGTNNKFNFQYGPSKSNILKPTCFSDAVATTDVSEYVENKICHKEAKDRQRKLISRKKRNAIKKSCLITGNKISENNELFGVFQIEEVGLLSKIDKNNQDDNAIPVKSDCISLIPKSKRKYSLKKKTSVTDNNIKQSSNKFNKKKNHSLLKNDGNYKEKRLGLSENNTEMCKEGDLSNLIVKNGDSAAIIENDGLNAVRNGLLKKAKKKYSFKKKTLNANPNIEHSSTAASEAVRVLSYKSLNTGHPIPKSSSVERNCDIKFCPNNEPNKLEETDLQVKKKRTCLKRSKNELDENSPTFREIKQRKSKAVKRKSDLLPGRLDSNCIAGDPMGLFCAECGLSFDSPFSREDHEQDCRNIAFEMSLMAEDLLFECPYCQLTFALKSTQRQHSSSCRAKKTRKNSQQRRSRQANINGRIAAELVKSQCSLVGSNAPNTAMQENDFHLNTSEISASSEIQHSENGIATEMGNIAIRLSSVCKESPEYCALCALLYTLKLNTNDMRCLLASSSTSQSETLIQIQSNQLNSISKNVNSNFETLMNIMGQTSCFHLPSTFESCLQKYSKTKLSYSEIHSESDLKEESDHQISINISRPELLKALSSIEELLKEAEEVQIYLKKQQMLLAMKETFQADTGS